MITLHYFPLLHWKVAHVGDFSADDAGRTVHWTPQALKINFGGRERWRLAIPFALPPGAWWHSLLAVLAGTYKLLASGQLVAIHPSSVLAGRKVPCIVFDELVQTTRRYARTVTAIDPRWLPELAPHLFRSSGSVA